MLRRLRITEYDFFHKTTAFTRTMYFLRFGDSGFGESGLNRPTGIGSGIGCSIGDTDTIPIPLVSARYRYRVLVSV